MVEKKKNNLGCFGIGAIGCGLFIVLIGIIVGVIVFIFSYSGSIGSSGETIIKEGSESKIAVIRIDGLITEGDSAYDYTSGYSSASSEGIINQLELAVADENVEAILLRMNTPGGEIVATDLIYQKVAELDSQKPIVTWMSGMGASGGYYIACGTRYIVVHSETITGSIGVIMEISSLEGLYEMLGIETRTFKSGRYKDDEGLFDSDEEGAADQILQELVDESYENFYNIVKEERDFTDEQLSEFADGRVVSGRSALEFGMVDEIGTSEDAIEVIEDIVGIDDMSIIEYDYGGFWDSLYGYSNSILDKFGLSGSNLELGAKLYYVIDL